MRRLFTSSIVLITGLLLCVSSALTNEPKTFKQAVVQETKSRCTRLTYEAGGNKKELRKLTRNTSAFQGAGAHCPRLTSGPRTGEFLPNTPPKVGLSASTAYLGVGASSKVRLKAIACDLEDYENLLYVYSTTGGRITGDGANTIWDLKGVVPGTYFATVEVDDGCGCISHDTTQVVIAAP